MITYTTITLTDQKCNSKKYQSNAFYIIINITKRDTIWFVKVSGRTLKQKPEYSISSRKVYTIKAYLSIQRECFVITKNRIGVIKTERRNFYEEV